MAVKVTRITQVTLNPRAECLGDNPDQDAETNCDQVWDYGRDTLSYVKAHIQSNPTHQVGVVHETRSLYEANN